VFKLIGGYVRMKRRWRSLELVCDSKSVTQFWTTPKWLGKKWRLSL